MASSVLLALTLSAPARAQCTAWNRCTSTLGHGQSPTSMVIDAANVYWGNRSARTIVWIPKHGGPITTLATAEDSPFVDAVDSTTVIWHTKSEIRSTPRSGGPTTRLDLGKIEVVVARPPLVLWAGSPWYRRQVGPWVAPPAWNLPEPDPRPPADPPTVVHEATPSVIILHGPFLLWANPAGIACERRIAPSGTTQLTLAEQAPVIVQVANVTALTTDNAFLYARAGHSIVKAPLGGGAPVTLATQQEPGANIATDGLDVYWTNPQAGTVNAVSTYGGTVVTIASGQMSPQNLAVDEDSVYFVAGDSVIRVTPK